MRQVNVVIVEDEFFVANHLKELIEQYGFRVCGVYHSGEQFVQQTDWKFDVAIVDIFLSDKMDGLQVAEHLNTHHIPFFFLTANQDSHTLREAARLSPRAYLSKPFNTNDIRAVLEMISHEASEMIQVRSNHGTEEINPNNIYFIKSDGAYIELHTSKGRIVQRKLLKDINESLPPFFERVHRSYIVNRNYIEKRTATYLFVSGVQIPTSKNFKKN